MEEKTSRGGEKASRRNNPASKVSFRWELRGGPVARVASPLDPQVLQAILQAQQEFLIRCF